MFSRRKHRPVCQCLAFRFAVSDVADIPPLDGEDDELADVFPFVSHSGP